MRRSHYLKRKRFYDFLLGMPIPIISERCRRRIYDTDFFTEASAAKTSCAEAVAQILVAHLDFQTVFDIGCGTGIFLDALHRLGKTVLGCDSSPDALRLSSKAYPIFLADATQPILFNTPFDLVVCFEVAEHIPPRNSASLVRNCTTSGRCIAFTAAPPGQGGIGHINEKPYAYWIRLFSSHSFVLDPGLTDAIKTDMRKHNVVPWISANFMCFVPA
jgi:2-polyprenyl-3-methyl-5-hydroxy-6-metoxy-1,4-benzoquinol methylase